MEKVKNPAKKEKAGTDGLSKKERRALKVQEKQKQSVEKTDTVKAKDASELSEKELRRLEFEKKLAEKKIETEKENLSKAEIRAKRREQQEAQRAAKSVIKPEPKKIEEVKVEAKKPTKPVKLHTKRLEFVNHLYTDATFGGTIVNYRNVHPVFVRLGVQFATKKILGSNARCRALLTATKCLINDLQTPPKQEFCRYLENVLQSCMQYLNKCRPSAVSMNNALRHFKSILPKVENLPDNVKKETLLESIDTYIVEEINKAGDAISLKVREKINDGDVVLTYGCSSLIKKILEEAHLEKKRFEVIVVDGRPLLEGRQMLKRLVQIGISCTYVQINALSYVMGLATKVLLGAHALLTNGYVMSRIGTAQVAMMAQAFNRPVLVCCETYKFSEQVLTDSFVYNELGDPEMLTLIDTVEEKSSLVSCRSNDNLQILNLLYDVTPPDLVTAVVTELAVLPCTSAPVILRIKP